MATRRIREFLSGNKVPYGTINHACAYTAPEVAQTSHVPGRYLAKSVIVSLDGKLALVVVPSTKRVDLAKLGRQTGASDVRLADEAEFRNQFEGCQVGAVPPFGVLFGAETWVDRQLAFEQHIAFNAGTHTDVYVVRYPDFVRLAHPQFVDVAVDVAIDQSNAAKGKPSKSKSRRRCCEDERSEFSPEAHPVAQAQCGCPVEYHEGSD
jgi:Ala-tRNA(Pro) deacylase